MKLKCQPADFHVTELTSFASDGGPFALYRLTKESLGTLEAISQVAQRWRLTRAQVSFGGLKDKHARTEQYLTVHDGPGKNLVLGKLQLEYLGQASRPFTPRDIQANRFHVVVRELTPDELASAAGELEAVLRDGLPNYFDDQRFGSLGHSGEFVARAWCQGDYQRALWLAVADPREDDTGRERDRKRILREQWGDWQTCRAALAGFDQARGLAHLASQPTDFRGAWAKMPVDLRGIYLAAFQSFLWNRMLATLLRRECPASNMRELPSKCGPLPCFIRLSPAERERLAQTQLPLPSARLHLEDGPLKQLVVESLQPLGLELRQVRVKHPRDSFFAKGERAAVVQPADLAQHSAADERYPGFQQWTLDFTLPRGVYATLLIKRACLKLAAD